MAKETEGQQPIPLPPPEIRVTITGNRPGIGKTQIAKLLREWAADNGYGSEVEFNSMGDLSVAAEASSFDACVLLGQFKQGLRLLIIERPNEPLSNVRIDIDQCRINYRSGTVGFYCVIAPRTCGGAFVGAGDTKTNALRNALLQLDRFNASRSEPDPRVDRSDASEEPAHRG